MITPDFILNLNIRLLNVRNRQSFRTLLTTLTDTIPFLSAAIYTFSPSDDLRPFVESNNNYSLTAKRLLPDTHLERNSIMARAELGAFVQIDDIQTLAKKTNASAFVKSRFSSGIADSLYIGMKIERQTYSLLVLDSKKRGVFNDEAVQRIRFLSQSFALATSWILLSERQKNELAQHVEETTSDRTNGYHGVTHPDTNDRHDYCGIVGRSTSMQDIYSLITQVAQVDSTVLILGETGTGKELIANAIHRQSRRKDATFVKINCAALPANLIESELFGHEKGSFTGALERRIGKFETANNGTIFLDEIGEVPLPLQAKLLRAIQEREIQRVGGTAPIKVNVRIVAATNRNLRNEVNNGRFRSDLYYRLNVFPITIPALRERNEDILPLAEHFLHHYRKAFGKNITGFSKKVKNALLAYVWPGNVRELQHLIERSVLLAANGKPLQEIQLPTPPAKSQSHNEDDLCAIKTIHDLERDHILHVLKRCRGKVAGPGGAALLLGIPPSTLNSKAAKLGIKRDRLMRRTY